MEQELRRPRRLTSAQEPAPRRVDTRPAPAALLDRVVSAASRRSTDVVLVALIAAMDWAIPTQQLPFLPRALIDEPGHLATAVIVLGALTRWRGRPPSRRFAVTMLAASVLIDIDHIPGHLGWGALTAGTPRPYTHALWLPAALAVIAIATRGWGRRSLGAPAAVSQVAAGAALGLCAHFLRDLTTAPIALLWPASGAGLQMSYGWYLVALMVLAIWPGRVRPSPENAPPPEVSGRRFSGGR